MNSYKVWFYLLKSNLISAKGFNLKLNLRVLQLISTYFKKVNRKIINKY